MANNFRQNFQAYLHYRIIHEGHFKVEDVSKEMDISASLLYKYISGERQFPQDLYEPFLKATDYDHLRKLAKRCGFHLVPIIENKQAIDCLKLMIAIFSSSIDLGEK